MLLCLSTITIYFFLINVNFEADNGEAKSITVPNQIQKLLNINCIVSNIISPLFDFLYY